MVTKSDTVDVFILKDTNLLSAIKNKGYFTDLSENDKLKTQYADMYPAFMHSAQGIKSPLSQRNVL